MLRIHATSLIRSTCVAAGAVAALAASATAHAAPVLLGLDDASNSVVEINTVTGEVTTFVSINTPTGASQFYEGLGVGEDGALFTTAILPFGNGGQLVEIDPVTGDEILREQTLRPNSSGALFRTGGNAGLAFDSSDQLFGAFAGSSSSFFGALDEDTAIYSDIQQTAAQIVGGTFIRDLAFSPDDTLYGIGTTSGLSGTRLFTLDLDNGDVTDIGGIVTTGAEGVLESIAFGDDGTLFGITSGLDDRLMTIDVLTAMVVSNIALGAGYTVGGPANPLDINGISFAAMDGGSVSEVPLPAAAWLFIAGAFGLYYSGRRETQAGGRA